MLLECRCIQLRNLPSVHSTNNHHSTFQDRILSESSCQLDRSIQADTYLLSNHLSLRGRRIHRDIFLCLANLVFPLNHIHRRNNQLGNLCTLYFNQRSYKFWVGTELGPPCQQYLQYSQYQGQYQHLNHMDSSNQLDMFCKCFILFDLDIFLEGTTDVMTRA
jgi:hypothetical protein